MSLSVAKLFVLKLNLFLLCACIVLGNNLRLDGNRYENLVVAIDDKLEESQCQYVIAGLTRTLRAASGHLFTATGRRAELGNITVMLPVTWPESCVSLVTGSQVVPAAAGETASAAQVQVGSDHPVLGPRPWAQQWGQCGQEGSAIHLSANSLTGDSNITARQFVLEWAKFRWGVFEETGFAGDDMYPSFYQSTKDHWTPTGCTDGSMSGTATPLGCSKEKNECSFAPSSRSARGLTASSIMDPSFLSLAKSFCDESNHNRAAPTKHNLLCGGRSVWAVISETEDFRNERNPPSGALAPGPVHFRWVRPRPSRVYVLAESTLVMRRLWQAVRDSVINYASWQAPPALHLGVALFGRAFSEKRALAALQTGVRTLPGFQPYVDDVAESEKRWREAIESSIVSMGEEASGSTIVMVTGNSQPENGNSLPQSDITAIADLLKANNVRLVVVFFPFPTPGLDQVALKSGGEVIVLDQKQDTVVPVLHALMSAYDTVVNKYGSDHKQQRLLLEQKEFKNAGKSVRGQFVVDGNASPKQITVLILLDQPKEIRSIRLRKHERQFEPDRIFSTNAFEVVAQFTITEGSWQYEVNMYETISGSLFVEVFAAAQADVDLVRLNMWTSAGESGVWNASEAPLAIYAQVHRGNVPVVNATVSAVIEKADGSQVSLNLLDDGLGVADITRGDGIYSRYLHDLSSNSNTSRQVIRLHATVTGNQGFLVTSLNGSPDFPCCGSSFPLDRAVTESVKHLRRVTLPTVIQAIDVPPASVDVFPPTRITDLRAAVNQTRGTITFKWTAPEDSSTSTRVARYEVRYCEQRETLWRRFDKCTSVPHWTQPEQYGSASNAEIEFNVYDRLIHFAMLAEDNAGNTAVPSNIVSVVVRPPLSSPHSGNGGGVKATASLDDREIPLLGSSAVLTIVVCLAAGALIAIAVLILTCLQRRRSHSIKTGSDIPTSSLKTDNSIIASSYANPVGSGKGSAISSSLPNTTPVMWSASDILRNQNISSAIGVPPTCSASSSTSSCSYGGIGGYSGVEGYGSVGGYGADMCQQRCEETAGSQAPTESTVSSEQLLHVSGHQMPTAQHLEPHLYGGLYNTSKVAPPTLPKPSGVYTASTAILTGSWESVTEKRRRNVTQV